MKSSTSTAPAPRLTPDLAQAQGSAHGQAQGSAVGVPRPRADAVRNRERILAAAREAFVESGSGAPFDEVARRAASAMPRSTGTSPTAPPSSITSCSSRWAG